MILIQKPQQSTFSPCSYLNEKSCRFEYFLAFNLDGDELDDYLSRGWRKFGVYYFRPDCNPCFSCVPIRILVREFSPSKSQRRVLRKGGNIEMQVNPLKFREEIYEIYRMHSLRRFNKDTDIDEFFYSFYTQSCPSLQTEYFIDGKLIGVGFLDRSKTSLSSVYFIYDTDYESYRPGTFSIIKEIELAASMGLEYYYLGYHISENHSMAYKNKFHPYECYDWMEKSWVREDTLDHDERE